MGATLGACSDSEFEAAGTGGQSSGGHANAPGAGGNGGTPGGGEGGGPILAEPTCVTGDASLQASAPWDWVGIVGTGQSLAVGTTPITSTTQPYNNLMLSLGEATVPPWDAASDPTLEMVPLVEPLRSLHRGYPAPYPGNLFGETPHSAMANALTFLAKCPDPTLDFITVHTVVGESGQGMVALEKQTGDSTGETGRAYAATLFEAEAITRLAAEAGKTYGIGAIVMTHGETDNGSSGYKNQLLTLWTDYNADLAAITGQTATIPMYLSQQHAYPNEGVGGRPLVNTVLWELGVEHPGDFVVTGPKYQYPGNDDGVHLAVEGYQALGEKTAQVYYERTVLGRDWQPLQPTSAERDGRVVTVHFNVPVPPLRWDEGLDAPLIAEWANGRGFELRNGSFRRQIESVAIVGDTVEITAAEDLPASGLMVAYALSSQGGQMTTASFAVRWGQLCDSDLFVGSTTGLPNPNYGISFEMPVR
ncbi:MAG: dockerin [Polyangiaceae bacterium]|nr:dockerin [Polyangiaceae bacterium]